MLIEFHQQSATNTNQRTTKKIAVTVLHVFGPPNSAPATFGDRRIKSTAMHAMAQQRKTMTVNANDPAFTLYGTPSVEA